MKPRYGFVFFSLIVFARAALSWAAVSSVGPVPYLSQTDLPLGFAEVEDFEDGIADSRLDISPGLIIGPGFDSGIPDITDSVDADDGEIDGSGSNGHSFFYSLNEITVEFSKPMIAAGLVFTDGPQEMELRLQALDSSNNSLGEINWTTTADGVFTGTTAEDRFVGFLGHGDILKLVISQTGPGLGIEIDHISFTAIPEPTGITLLALAGGILLVGRRRRHRGSSFSKSSGRVPSLP